MEMETEMLDRLKLRLGISEAEQDLLLVELLDSATALFLSLRYPTTPFPTDLNGDLFIEWRYTDWILRCAAEFYGKMGIEGQVSSTENGITRSYDSGTVSRGLLAEVTPVAGVAR